MPFKRWTRTTFFALAALIWLGLGVVVPVVMSSDPGEVPGDSVEASSSDTYGISEPIVLSELPLVRVERGTVAFVDSAGAILPLTDRAVLAGTAGIRLFNAVISISPGAARGAAAVASEQSPFAAALATGRYESLSLRRTTVLVSLSGDGLEPISDVKAEVSLRRRGNIAVKGTGQLRGRAVSFDATSGVVAADRKAGSVARIPLRFTMKGEQIDVAFDGRTLLDGAIMKLEGTGELSMVSGRSIARWLGAYWPTGGGLRDISVRGQVDYTRNTLSFDKATVRMDGNEGAGVLAVRFSQPRPVVSGTLAYKTIDAGPYLSGLPFGSAEALSWSSLAASVLTVPLGMHLDADLRISADRVSLGKLDLGPSAATVALKDGRMLADVAGLKLHGGEGGGQITADFNGFLPKVTVRGKLENIDAALLSSSLAGSPHVQGRVSVVADLAGSGGTLKGVLDALSGRLTIRSQSPGKIALDLRGMSVAVRTRELTGWHEALRTPTAYEKLDLRLVLRDGSLLTETAEVKAADANWVATGIVNLLSDRIDLRLTQSAPAASGAHGAAQSVVELKGALSEPQIKADFFPLSHTAGNVQCALPLIGHAPLAGRRDGVR